MCREELTCRRSPTHYRTVPDDVFLALANPVRRRLLSLLDARPRTAGELAAEFAGELSRPAVAEHLGLLKRAHLVADEQRGRQRVYRLTPEPLEEIGEWLAPFERYWRRNLRTLAHHVEHEMEDDE
jgi:DNA-binding transcriptional ArsR family regulator